MFFSHHYFLHIRSMSRATNFEPNFQESFALRHTPETTEIGIWEDAQTTILLES
jgi:hypothetical protein